MSTCTEHADCPGYVRGLVEKYYGTQQRAPRRTPEEVALDRKERGQVIAARREFNRKKRAEAEQRRAALKLKEESNG